MLYPGGLIRSTEKEKKYSVYVVKSKTLRNTVLQKKQEMENHSDSLAEVATEQSVWSVVTGEEKELSELSLADWGTRLYSLTSQVRSL